MRIRSAGPPGATARTSLPLMIAFVVQIRARACLPIMRRHSIRHLTAARRAPLYADKFQGARMSDAVITEVTEGIATVTLNKPWKLNAWDTPMRAEITAALKSWNQDKAVRAVIMTGMGDRAFCAGQDLEETEKFQSGSEG